MSRDDEVYIDADSVVDIDGVKIDGSTLIGLAFPPPGEFTDPVVEWQKERENR